ncbi:MAG: phosphoribosylformylglycinamidine cyclo-ligase [Nannocystaceae bacterium]|nr:phosphoribosylformylglycinamidine cyclo-ligase [Deltaproteobacteria bacterium]MBP7287493.1 phosphoribosylformylglycinamidine cyclo-ligase [Nannocystaceae bacterium]
MSAPGDPPRGSGDPAAGPLTYRDAGVDIDAGNHAVERIKRLVAGTRRPEQLSDLGGFAGLMGLPRGMTEPVLVSCTDGVGTKLLVSIALDRHDTVGIDLVAMNVNDLLVTGAEPLFVLDYIAVGKLVPTQVEALVAGIVEGCKQSGAALLGGETAELPGLYAPGHYDLAAFAVGVVDRAKLLGPQRVVAGDVVIALRSSGLHSNGYSLARRALLEVGKLGFDDALPFGDGELVGEVMLRPTVIYAKAFAALRALAGAPLHAAAHITGGGLIENPPRALPAGLAQRLDLAELPPPPVFRAIAAQGVAPAEMQRTFNCGVGMLLYVAREGVDAVLACLREVGQPGVVVGEVVPHRAGAPEVELTNLRF